MPPRCAKCATPERLPVTPKKSSTPAYSVAKSHAGIGMGGINGTTLRCGNIKAYASNRPNTPPEAPIVGAGDAPSNVGTVSWVKPAVTTDAK